MKLYMVPLNKEPDDFCTKAVINKPLINHRFHDIFTAAIVILKLLIIAITILSCKSVPPSTSKIESEASVTESLPIASFEKLAPQKTAEKKVKIPEPYSSIAEPSPKPIVHGISKKNPASKALSTKLPEPSFVLPPAVVKSAAPPKTPEPIAAQPKKVPAPAVAAEPKPAEIVPPQVPPQAPPQPTAPSATARVTDPVPSRVTETRINTPKSARFELSFPGSGWIYLGDEAGQDGIKYESRRFDNSQIIFAFTPTKAGEYVLRFQRQNPITKTNDDNLVRVTVLDKSENASGSSAVQKPNPTARDSTSASASSSASTTTKPEASEPAKTSELPASNEIAKTSAAPAILENIKAPDELLNFARTELDAKRVQSAIQALDKYIELYHNGNDELYYLYALAYEQDTPFRDIKLSHSYYKRVTTEYPRSKWWNKSEERIKYLERYYFGLK